MTIEVLRAESRLDDPTGIDTFLASVPKGEGLRDKLKPGQTYRAEQYDAPTLTARYLAADGVQFVCFVVVGVTLEQARAIARETHTLAEWSTRMFHRCVERALNVTFPKSI